MSWQSTTIRKPWTHSPFCTNWTALLSAETKLHPDLNLPLLCTQMPVPVFWGYLFIFPFSRMSLRDRLLSSPSAWGQRWQHKGESPKKHPISADVGICKSRSAGELIVQGSTQICHLLKIIFPEENPCLLCSSWNRKVFLSLQYISAPLNHFANSAQIERNMCSKLRSHPNTVNLHIEVFICSQSHVANLKKECS